MRNLIDFVAGTKVVGKENLATEILAEIIRSPVASAPLRKYLRSFSIDLPSYYSIRSQKGVPGHGGIPDLCILDENGVPLTIIESKFYAGLTPHQPSGYLQMLRTGGLLIFVVPEERLDSLFREVCERCGPTKKSSADGRRQTEVERKVVVVASWAELLSALGNDQEPASTMSDLEEYTIYLNELKGFCDVLRDEIFEPLTELQIRGNGISEVIHQLKWLTDRIIRRCIAEGILQEVATKGKCGVDDLRAETDTSLYFGQNLLLGEFPIWLGFYASMWEKHQVSPLWIWFANNGAISARVVTTLRQRKGEQFVIQSSTDGKDAFLIAIPVAHGCSQQELVESARNFVEGLKQTITKK